MENANPLLKSVQRVLIIAVMMVSVAMVVVAGMVVMYTMQSRPINTVPISTEIIEDPAAYSLSLANAYRGTLRLPALNLSAPLSQVAQGYAHYYAQEQRIHLLDDVRVRSDLNAQRYYIGGDLRQAYGRVEPGFGMGDMLRSVMEAEAVVRHLEDGAVRDMGFGWAESSDGGYYYAVLLTFPEVMTAPNVGISGAPSQEAQQAEIMRLLNEARAAAGLSPLRVNPNLTTAAYWHSIDMASRERMGHDGTDGTDPPARAIRHGYSRPMVGENVLVRPSLNASGAFDQWWNSPPHFESMMYADFREIGIAYAVSMQGNYYYTMLLGG